MDRYCRNKVLNKLPKCGRNRCTSQNEVKQIIQFSERQKAISTTLIQQKMKTRRVRILKDTIRKRLRENGGRWTNPNLNKFL